jgi:hypothetical protein
VLAPTAVFALFGYFTSAPSHGGGFGLFSSDLLAFVNPHGASWIVPTLRVQIGQWEGNAYLGLGGIALALVAGALAAGRWRPCRRRLGVLAPVVIACALMASFSLSNVVRAGGHKVIGLGHFYRLLGGLVGPFRSSGRFIWPFYYLAVAASVIALLKLARNRPRLATFALAAAVGLQLVDLAPRALAREFEPRPWRPRSPTWLLARGRYDHLALVPPQVVGIWGPCRGMVYGDDDHWIPLAYEAYALGMTVNSGYVARGAGEIIGPPCVALEKEIDSGILRERTLYVAHATKLAAFERAGARCGRLDGYDVCVRPTPGDPFAEALAGRNAVSRWPEKAP